MAPSLEYFLRPCEKDELGKWDKGGGDYSVTSIVLSPFFQVVAWFMPQQAAPTVFTLVGSLAILQAWYFAETYADTFADIALAVTAGAVFVSWALNLLAGALTRRAMSYTPVTELFTHVCHMISSIFLVLTLCRLLAPGLDVGAQWYCVQAILLLFLIKHFSALALGGPAGYILLGPGEFLLGALGLLVARVLMGASALTTAYGHLDRVWLMGRDALTPHVTALSTHLDKLPSPLNVHKDLLAGGLEAMPAPYPVYMALLCIFAVSVILGGVRHWWSRVAMGVILALQTASGLLRLSMAEPVLQINVIADALFMTVVITDVIVAKMAKRELHETIVLTAVLIVLPQTCWVAIGFVVFYYVALFGDLTQYLNLPLLQLVRNVYCDGVYDLNHCGHKNAFRNASKLGHRLFCGVMGDEACKEYKRPPMMSAAEREAEVVNCKCVYKTISNAPCFGLTEEFIKKHRLHVVCAGQEYFERYPNPDDDPYYKVARKMGICVPMPRTDGISTSDLIKRIQDRGGDKKKSPT